MEVTPRQERQEHFSCRDVGWGCLLVEAEAGDVGFFDESGIVTLGLVEGKGEVLDAMLGTELHEEVGELSQFDTEPFYIVCRGDSAEQQHASEVRLVPLVYSLYCRFAVGVPKLSPRYFSMSASAAFSRGSLTTDMSVGGSALVAALVAGVALRPKMFFTREMRLLSAVIFWNFCCWFWN